MLTAEELQTRQQEIVGSPELAALLERLAQRAAPVLQRSPLVPTAKALLTADGGVCPEHGVRLEFDPWSPTEHRCPRCGRRFTGERHDRAWAHYQHLWVSERAAHLATLASMAGREDAATRANAVLQAYRNYPEYPNRDNVLGPSRLFFSTYLESIWLTNYLAAATLLRDGGLLEAETAEIVAAVADEAANLIGEFDEGLSNRQTWHNAALAAVAVWFEDEELATRMLEGPSGILTHLLQGFGADGMWFEGDNYHLFALRGQLVAMGWARQAGVDLLADSQLADRLSAALSAPALTALPDGTFPARKDSRFGVSLAQPMYLELWEVGLARLERAGIPQAELWDWLRLLYQTPAPPAQTFDSYLHEAGEALPTAPRTRADLSWWSLLEMLPTLPDGTGAWSPGSVFFEGQGLAILRQGNRYASLECGTSGGGHGHPDRLNLVLHADGEYWLPDLGTGSYVARDLFWYRSTLAHNAPRLDGVSQRPGDALCDNFDQQGEWGWARGRFGDLTRTLVSGPSYLLDILDLSSASDQLLELPLHLSGRSEVTVPGHWVPAELSDEFVAEAQRFVPDSPGPLRLSSSGKTGARISILIDLPDDLIRATGPGIPGTGETMPFYLLRSTGRKLRIATLLEPGSTPAVTELRVTESGAEVQSGSAVERHILTVEGWEVRSERETIRLRGGRKAAAPFRPLMQNRPLAARGVAPQVAEAPALDGSLDGFDTSEPLELDHEDQYRRSEEPYGGPEEFSARAYVNWSDAGLHVAVEVTKPDLVSRDPAAAPLRLDNEPDEIHADGIQLYVRPPQEEVGSGILIVPSKTGELIVRGVEGTAGAPDQVTGGWSPTDTGYLVTVTVTPPDWGEFRPGAEIGFDLLINQMLPDRLRRAGQLVWSGGGGWVWLRGDRQDPARFGTLELG
ncbi:MAG: heparinase II/III family protein [Gemmatimonadales bacterium]